ncbi:hypothetical protein JTB14_037190 [Gonioctena quinquepunctata]|nr:hypothetical protein JTB14_037190 [Gonioctena quinquepunctata]
MDELLGPIEPMFEDQSQQYVLTYEELKNFFENIHGSVDPLSVAKSYTSDITGLLNLLHKIYPLLTERKIKTRCTKVQNKIRKQLQLELISDIEDSDTSQETFKTSKTVNSIQ